MARDCVQLLESGYTRDESETEIDALWVESHLRFPVLADAPDSQPDIATMSCLMLDLVRTPQSAAQMALLATSMQGVRVRRERLGASDLAAQLASSMVVRDDDFGSAVLLLGDGVRASEEVQSIVDALRARQRDTTGLIVAVSSAPARSSGLRGVDGFVAASAGREAAVASQLVVMLSSMMAPYVLACLDAEDLLPTLGSPQRPARLVEAFWFEQRQLLAFACDADERAFLRSASIAAFIFASKQAPEAGITQAFRRFAREGRSMAYQVPVDFLVEATAHTCCIRVKLLCSGGEE